MGTPFVHTLLPFDTYESDSAGDIEGTGVQTIGRTDWDFTLEVAEVTSVTVVLQAAAVDDDDEYATVDTFEDGAITSTGSYTLTAPTDFTVQPFHEWIRAKVTAQTGDATIMAKGSAAFIDPTDFEDTLMLTKAVREWDDGLDRTVERAERDVRALLLSYAGDEAEAGRLAVHGTAQAAYDEIRDMVAEQTDWLYRKHQLFQGRDTRAEALSMDDLAPGLMSRARKLQPKAHAYWRGR